MICVDLGGPPCAGVCEEDEYNNCHTAAVDIVPFVPSIPDLVITDLKPAPGSTVYRGRKITMTCTIKNAGTGDVHETIPLALWLSLDGNVVDGDFNDPPLGAPLIRVDLVPGGIATYRFTTPFTIPWTAFIGPQHLVAWVDFGVPPCSVICESNEMNNARATPVYVR